MKQKSKLKILFPQLRADIETRTEERESFARFAGLNTEQIDSIDLFTQPIFEPTLIDNYDALFVGGSSGEGTILLDEQKPDYVETMFALLRYSYDKSIPVFASCFGFQAATVALGGTLIKDEEHMEAGTYDISLTKEAHNDLLFHDTPNPFAAITVHAKRASVLPEGAVNLCYTDACPIHAFVIAGKPFYGFQYHPEVDKRVLVERLTRYQAHYKKDNDELKTILDSTRPVPEANALVGKFVDRVLLA